MKSKFVRILLIINGILIPIFILFVLGNYFKDKLNSNFEYKEPEIVESEYETKQSSLISIPNSEFYLIAEYKKRISIGEFSIQSEEQINLPYSVPENTLNLIFLDKDLNHKRKLLKENASIKSMFVSHPFNNDFNEIEEITHLSFYIATEDSNEDGIIDKRDQHYVYISDVNGKNLTKVTDRKIKQYEWINGNKELLLNFKTEDNTKLEYGVYNIKNKTITIKETL